MTGRRLIHAHKLVQEYAAEPVPTRLFAARSDGLGRDVLQLPTPANPNLMAMVRDFPIYYWSHEAMIKGSAWTSGVEKEIIGERMVKAAKSKGAIHFFDVPQAVDNPEMGTVLCAGMIRYAQDMFALIYVYDDFNWDNLSHKSRTYNIYFVNGSSFAEFYKTWMLMLEAYANTPIECDIVQMTLTPKRVKGIDHHTRKNYIKNPVRVVTLRKFTRTVNETRDRVEVLLNKAGEGHTIAVQFDVRGHTRNQWYPSEGKNRVIWVEGYTKGKDKPRIERATVNKVIDRQAVALQVRRAQRGGGKTNMANEVVKQALSPPGSGMEGLLQDVMGGGK